MTMRSALSLKLNPLLLALMALPSLAVAQTTHVVQVLDYRFEPKDITIQAGDTVRWVNPPGGGQHNVAADDFSFFFVQPLASFTFEHTFTQGGVHPYSCQPHKFDGMVGSVTVLGSIEPSVDINPGHGGNWWGGLARNGEGVQIEVADSGGGDLVFVVTLYSYGPEGGQIFLIGVGTPEGNSVTVDVFITDGGAWGTDFDPDDVAETAWGSGVFAANGCDQISMVLTPNGQYAALGYTELAYDLTRLTSPSISCPYE